MIEMRNCCYISYQVYCSSNLIYLLRKSKFCVECYSSNLSWCFPAADLFSTLLPNIRGSGPLELSSATSDNTSLLGSIYSFCIWVLERTSSNTLGHLMLHWWLPPSDMTAIMETDVSCAWTYFEPISAEWAAILFITISTKRWIKKLGSHHSAYHLPLFEI